MYGSADDIYCYPGTQLLKNLPGLRSQARLDRFEAAATGRRFLEPMPAGRWSVRHYCRVHRHIFQDVYPWAGRLRVIRIGKGGSMFCYPEHIPTELARVFSELSQRNFLRGRDASSFAAAAAHFLAELNAIHAFRDGNGRTQLAFTALMAAHAGHPLYLDRLNPSAFLSAMIASFQGQETDLARQLRSLL